MNFSDLSINTAWIRALDPDAEFAVDGSALWIVFCGDAGSVADHALQFYCIDLLLDHAWISWDDASSEDRADATLFRYILITD
jgi:hypothetical protein